MTSEGRAGAPLRHSRPLRNWVGFVAVVAVAAWLLGPLALGVGLVVGGVALVRAGWLHSGWPRPLLIVVGLLLLLLPLLVWWELAGGIVELRG